MAEAPEPQFLLHSEPAWRGLLGRLNDLIRHPPEPELKLESKPIAVKDIWSPPKPLKTRLTSFAVHAAIIGIAMLPFWRPVRVQVKRALEATSIYIPPSPEPAPQLPRLHKLAGGGVATPRPEPKLLQTPKAQPVASPTALVPMSEMPLLPSFGAIGPISGPPGAGGGRGGGPGGGGSGPEGGNCLGPNCGSGSEAVEMPVALYAPDPEYSDAARKAKFQGTVVVQVTVGADGRVTHPVVIQPLGLGLDQKAIQAVMQWRFRPARDKHGQPIPVTADIEVNFHLY